jgi:hypothetical protein
MKPRIYEFYDNGRTFIGLAECFRSEVGAMARQYFTTRTRYIDILDEGVTVARIEA